LSLVRSFEKKIERSSAGIFVARKSERLRGMRLAAFASFAEHSYRNWIGEMHRDEAAHHRFTLVIRAISARESKANDGH
jgi:hypothetical protein